MRRLVLWTVGSVLVVLLLLGLFVAWLLATEGGARWLLARAEPYLPDPLEIAAVSGSVMEGLAFRRVSWNEPGAAVSVEEFETLLEVRPLFRRELRIRTLTLREVEVAIGERPPQQTDPDAAPLRVDLPIGLHIENASVDRARIINGDRELVIDQVRLVGELRGSALRIDRFDLQSELADFSLAGNAQLEGPYTVDTHAAWELRLPGQAPLSGILRLRGDTSGYEIRHDLDAPYAVETRGTLAHGNDGWSVDVNNTWRLVRVMAGDAPVLELADGGLRLSGPMTELAISAATTLTAGDIPPLAVSTSGRFGDSRVSFDSLSAVNDWGRLVADGQVRLAPEPNWDFNIALSDADPGALDARLSGILQARGKTSGRLVDGKPVLTLKMDTVSGNLNGYPVAGSGSFSFAGNLLQIENGVARIGDNRVDIDGSYGQQLELDAKLRFADLGQLGLGAAGRLNADIQLASDLRTLRASGYVSASDLAWQETGLDTLEATFDLPSARPGTIALRAAAAEYGSLDAEMSGRFVSQQWTGSLTRLTVDREPVGEWSLQDSAEVLLSRSRLRLGELCLGSLSIEGTACGAVDYDFSGPLRFSASIDALPLASLPRSLPAGATVLGEINATVTGDFRDGRLNADAGLELAGLGLVASFEGDEVSANFAKASINASVVDNRLVGAFEFTLDNAVDHAAGRIEIANLFDPGSALLGQGSMEFNDLALLSFFVPDLANPVGQIFGSVDVSGSLRVPEIVGEIGLRDGSVDIRRAGISISEAALVLRQSAPGELALDGRARSGDGYLGITGKTTLTAEAGLRTEVRLDGENFRLIRLPDWNVTASPRIDVLFDERATRVTGEIVIPEANITVQTVPETTEKPSPDAVVHRENETIKQRRRMLFVKVRTVLGDKVFFSGFGLSTGLEGSVRISGDSNSPYRSQGRVVLRDGRYQAYGQNLEIESGELVFNGPLGNPALNVRATRTASDKTVAGIHLTGTPSQLRSEVYSEPPLGDAEALSYLLTGRPLSNADSEEGDMLNQAAFALGLSTAGNVASRVRNELGLDTLGIQGGGENRQLVAGKRFGDRLFIEYAYGVVDSLGTLLLRYQLTSRLMVESRSGSVQNVDLVYSVKKP